MGKRRKGREAVSSKLNNMRKGSSVFAQSANPPEMRDEFDLGAIHLVEGNTGNYKTYQLTPERRLCCAMIHRAVLDYVGAANSVLDSEFKAAYRWIYYGETENTPFSFLWCCDAVAQDGEKFAGAIREGVAELRKEDLRAA